VVTALGQDHQREVEGLELILRTSFNFNIILNCFEKLFT
jgi:hypothetical protein